MRILLVTPYLPAPPRSGGQRRMQGLLRELSRAHEVSVLSLVDEDVDQSDGLRETALHAARIVTVPGHRYYATGAKKRLLQLASSLSPWSFEAVSFHEPALQKAFDELVSKEAFDVVQFEFAPMASYRRPRGRRWTCVLDEHNIEYDVLRRTVGAGASPARRAYCAIDWRKLRREERKAWRSFDGCVVTSPRDRELLVRDEPGTRVAVIPNGVDIEGFAPTTDRPVAGTVLFFGAGNYYPNEEGVLFFLREVWPRLKALRPGVRFRVVGPKPPPSIATWPDPDVSVVGYVDDLRTEIAKAEVVVAPLRIGGGTRLKVLEAMAMAKPTVATRLGAEGIEVRDGENIELVDAPDAFAQRIAKLLDDEPARRRLGEAARRLVVERYSWRSAVDGLVSFYEVLRAGGEGRRGHA